MANINSYPIFETNQVLNDKHLNELRKYLDEQKPSYLNKFSEKNQFASSFRTQAETKLKEAKKLLGIKEGEKVGDIIIQINDFENSRNKTNKKEWKQ